MAVTGVNWRVLRIQLAREMKCKPSEIDEIIRDRPQDIRDFVAVVNAENLSSKMKHDAAHRQAKSKGKRR